MKNMKEALAIATSTFMLANAAPAIADGNGGVAAPSPTGGVSAPSGGHEQSAPPESFDDKIDRAERQISREIRRGDPKHVNPNIRVYWDNGKKDEFLNDKTTSPYTKYIGRTAVNFRTVEPVKSQSTARVKALPLNSVVLPSFESTITTPIGEGYEELWPVTGLSLSGHELTYTAQREDGTQFPLAAGHTTHHEGGIVAKPTAADQGAQAFLAEVAQHFN